MKLNIPASASSQIAALAGRLIVSCQAPAGDPFRSPESMARFAAAAVNGGAAGIRANGSEDVRAIRQVVGVPVIGLKKRLHADGKVLITPSLEDAAELFEAGADIIAVDCTARGQAAGALDRVRQIRARLGAAVLADIATVDEAVAAAGAGADLIASTMRGYTDETAGQSLFDPQFIAALAARLSVPILAEGRIQSPEQAARAIAAGAYAVIVGTAITRPEAITRSFVQAVEGKRATPGGLWHVLGIDLGGTRTKAGIVAADGSMGSVFTVPTPHGAGRNGLLEHLAGVARQGIAAANERNTPVAALGVATAGWVDGGSGRIAWATANLPGWTGTAVADALHEATGLGVAVENDANALAIAERYFGAGRGVDDYLSITLGTGVGGGCFSGGRLIRGAHGLANAIGHIPIRHDGISCNCGRRGCLEVYTNAAALLSYAGDSFPDAESLIRAAHAGDVPASAAVQQFAGYLACGIAAVVHVLDPAMVVLSGGLAQNNVLLFTETDRQLSSMMIAADHRQVRVQPSPLGYHGGVLGAAAVAWERLGCGHC